MKKGIIITIIVVIILIIAGFFIYRYFQKQSGPGTVIGEESLEIDVVDVDGNPVPNLEVDLWMAADANGPPSAGIKITNDFGIATFNLPEGQFLVGFNTVNFPSQYVFPQKTSVNVVKGANSKSIVLSSKGD